MNFICGTIDAGCHLAFCCGDHHKNIAFTYFRDLPISICTRRSPNEFVPLYPLSYRNDEAAQDDEPDYDVHLYWSPRSKTPEASDGSPKSSADSYASFYGTKVVAFHFFHTTSGDTHFVPSFVTASPLGEPFCRVGQAGLCGLESTAVRDYAEDDPAYATRVFQDPPVVAQTIEGTQSSQSRFLFILHERNAVAEDYS
ncbi:hypothetical protein OE88DRAFT_1037220 [Heliocybe sulcata]|uniref:Uncharacterized protein n=1 Tax=Heliocybe sulcata TaxID=5364 RepID=A0A5C3MP72_9AGAM|nr:hypothetical protein OE88DRAFT_1037220 [Heliocybe sulcata]